MKPSLSIICPVYNEEKYIASCLDSVIAQDYPKDIIEVFVVDGMSTDKTRNIVMDYCLSYSFIHILDNPQKIVPYALNYGINKSKGEYIIRIDAHAIFPKDYFRVLVENAKLFDADNVGGIVNTLPADETTKAKAIAIALSHPFGMGNSYFRIGINNISQVDTVPFGCFRREIFKKIGLFDCDLTRNQDDEFNGRIIKNKGKIYLIPGIVIDYYARSTIRKVSTMFYQYGLFKPLVNRKLGAPANLRQFFPVLFTLGLIVGPIFSMLNKCFFYITLVVLLLYAFLSIYFSLKVSINSRSFPLLLYLPLVFFAIHVSYGWGYIVGIFKILTNQEFEVKTNR